MVGEGSLVGHEDVSETDGLGDAWRVIAPREIEFISYPYEWTFSQLKDAALLTLRVQLEALDTGFTLKDASAFNVQFEGGRPILIDSLSFERQEPDAPWVAYRQFCEHFLAPLALMAYVDVRLSGLLREHVDGVPLDLAASLLPGRTRLRFGLATHIHLHARAQRRYSDHAVAPRAGESAVAEGPARQAPPASAAPARGVRMSPLRRRALVENLRGAVEGLRWQPAGTEWADYAQESPSYSPAAAASKRAIVERLLGASGGSRAWDLGANTGLYSRVAADLGMRVLSLDVDPAAAERHYLQLRDGVAGAGAGTAAVDVLPLVMDLTNPSPGLGWAHAERRSLLDRADADVAMALALVHHLAIGRNVPLPLIADFLADVAPQVILEWVPKEDPMVQRLLASRRDVFTDYSLEGCRAAMGRHFTILEEAPIADSSRLLLHLRRLPR